jgi:molybdopterin converting factor small subunit
MVVSIEFLGKQRSITNTASIEMPIQGTSRVSDALEYVNKRYPELNLDGAEVLITVNQEMVSPDRLLKANDVVSFLPFIHGG